VINCAGAMHAARTCSVHNTFHLLLRCIAASLCLHLRMPLHLSLDTIIQCHKEMHFITELQHQPSTLSSFHSLQPILDASSSLLCFLFFFRISFLVCFFSFWA